MTEPDLDAMICSLPCEFCHEPPGHRCIIPKTGKLYPYPHAKRFNAAKRAGIIDQWRREQAAWLAEENRVQR